MKSYSGSFTTALGASHVRPVLLVQLEFASGTVRFTNAGQDIVWNTYTWTSVAGVGAIGDLRETLTGEAIGLQMELNALPSSWVQIAASEHVQGKPATVYIALLDDSYQVIEANIEFKGLIDVMPIQDQGHISKILLNVENRTIDFARPKVRRFNSADQQQDYPTDQFFSHVEAMAEAVIVWPHKDFFKR